MDRAADHTYRERNAPQDVLRGLYLSGKYATACVINILPFFGMWVVSLFHVKIPDVPWLFANASDTSNFLIISIVADAFYATLQTRQARLWPVAGAMALAMAGALSATQYFHMPLSGFAALNAEVAFMAGASMTVFLARFVYQLFQKRHTFGSWLINVGAALACALISAGLSWTVQDYLPNVAMVAGGALTGFVLLLMPAKDRSIAMVDATI